MGLTDVLYRESRILVVSDIQHMVWLGAGAVVTLARDRVSLNMRLTDVL